MNPEHKSINNEEMRPEYNLRGGVRGKYYKQYRADTNAVLLDPDVAQVFRDSKSVNDALRILIEAAHQVDLPSPPERHRS